jgi:hypothetical protein
MADTSCPPSARSSHSASRKPFDVTEDARLIELVARFGPSPWDLIADEMPGRSPRQCRERWVNYLSPDIRVGPWTEPEDYILLNQVMRFGTRWTTIALSLNGRSDSDVKNRWYSHLKDVAFQRPDGSWALRRDDDGSIAFTKKKRHHHIVCPYAQACSSLEKQAGAKERAGFPKIRLPSLVLDNSEMFLPPLLPGLRESSH